MARTPWKPTNGIKWHRLRLGLTQVELAAQVGVVQKYVPQWERWQRTPTEEHQARLAEVLGCEVSELLREIDPRLELEVPR